MNDHAGSQTLTAVEVNGETVEVAVTKI